MTRSHDQSKLAQLLPAGNLSDRWISLLDAMHLEPDAEKREHLFQYAHGYLNALLEAELISMVARDELRSFLIKGAAKHG